MKYQKFAIFILISTFLDEISSARYNSYQEDLKIGCLFDDESEVNELVLKYAVRYVNFQRNESFPKIEEKTSKVMYGNEYEVSSSACRMLKDRVSVIIGPSSPESSVFLRSLCDVKEVPLIELLNDGTSKHTINMHPSPQDLAMVYLDLIKSWEWEGFTILYEDAPWLPMVEYIIRNSNKSNIIIYRQLDVTGDGNYREPLKEVANSENLNIIICSSIEALPEILKQAQQVGLLTSEHRVIITSLDMHTIDLEPYQYSGTNITGFRMISPQDKFLLNITESYFLKWYRREQEKHNYYSDLEDIELPEGLTPDLMHLQTALTFDAILLFHSVMLMHPNLESQSINCNDQTSVLKNGISLFNSMKTFGPLKGLSGDIQFDQLGNREISKLEILELTSAGLEVIATWDQVNKIQTLKKPEPEPIDPQPNDIRNKTLRVAIGIAEPYAMIKNIANNLQGNDKYEGFSIDLIEELSKKLDFKYIFVEVEGNTVGKLAEYGWTGMIGMLNNGTVDLAITDLTITAERESVIDFTIPFMTLGIGILYRYPKPEDPDLFSFLDPLSSVVWICVMGGFFLVTFSMFFMGRLSPSEWDNPYPCIEEPELLENQFTFKNAMWFTIGAILQQGSDIGPKAPATRIVASLWWFFTLIMVSSYTANLAAFLVVENPTSLVKGIEDLKDNKHPELRYGCKKEGSTATFFRNSTDESYRKMYEQMDKWNSFKDVTEGVAYASSRKYAYIMETSTIDYMVQRHCNVTKTGPPLDEKTYGIGLKKKSPFRGALSEEILKLQESGWISKIKGKWWEEKRGGGKCISAASGGDANKPLSMKNVGGVFLVVCGGCLVAFIMGTVNWFWKMKNIAKASDISFKNVFMEEFKFFLKFNTHVKTVPGLKSSTHSNSANKSNSRSRSDNNINRESIGFRMSLKNLHKIPCDEAFDKI